MIDITNLVVQYGDQVALSIDQPIHIQKGDRVGVIGSNGAGKSSLVHALLGVISSKGNVLIGIPLDEIAVHLQSNHYAETMAVKHVIETVINCSIRDDKKMQELIHFFDFTDCLKKKFKALSGGQKQRLTLMLVLHQDSPLVFFDEVTSGLDFETRQRLIDLLISWYQDSDATLCMVSHYYEELETLVNKILYLEEGHVVDFGDKDELFHKYCGRTVIICDRTPENEKAVQSFHQLVAPHHLIALRCDDAEEEKRIAQALLENNIDYKRSSNDIEIMTVNAKDAWMKRKGA